MENSIFFGGLKSLVTLLDPPIYIFSLFFFQFFYCSWERMIFDWLFISSSLCALCFTPFLIILLILIFLLIFLLILSVGPLTFLISLLTLHFDLTSFYLFCFLPYFRSVSSLLFLISSIFFIIFSYSIFPP
jgi:hypothetical protein